MRTTTDSDLYTLTMDYDDMDRLTKTTYPDGTYEETKYKWLDAEQHRDRLDRWSYTYHDALRRVVQTKDPLVRITEIDWCATCGTLDGITDAEGNETRWERDFRGRVKKEIRADGKFWEYTYEAKTSRLKSVKDPNLQVKTYTYDLDDKLKGIAYSDVVMPTPDVTYGYADPYGRLQTMVDGTGMTTYAYHPAALAGALKLASVDGPGSDDLLEYGYDELGRVNNRKLNGTANNVRYVFDSLGRLRMEDTSPATFAGTFSFGYDGVSGRPISILYPSAQRADYTYYPNSGDHRLQEIHNKLPSGATLSKFGYTYFPPGSIATWSQQRGAGSPETYTLEYDLADQLKTSTLRNAEGTVLKTYGEGYDDAGNRTTHSVDTVSTSALYGVRNWITSQTPPPISFTHDENGNMTSDGTQTYEWDAENRLLTVKQGGNNIATFVYDGHGRRFSKTTSGVTRTYLYDGAEIVEERLSTGGAIKYFDGPGIDQHLGTRSSSGVQAFFASDHLGSVTDVTTRPGAITLMRQYDPWGNLVSGASTNGYAFTGREWDAEIGLYYYRARYYDPKIGRFISEDPIKFAGGVNFFSYVHNNAVNKTDPSGLDDGNDWRSRTPPSPRPPCPVQGTAACYFVCLNSLNPSWTIPAGGGLAAGAVQKAVPTLAVGCAWIGAGLGGWSLGTPIGCFLICSDDPCSWTP